jgi:hypothetical protein
MKVGESRKWPLVFSYRGRVKGKRFTAKVICASRVLAEQLPDGELWLSGSEPGWFAAGGASLKEADTNLKKMFHGILLDKAKEAPDFPIFRESLLIAFDDADRLVRKEWVDAWIANKDGKLDCTQLGELPRVIEEDASCWVNVVETTPKSDGRALEPRTQDVHYAVAA